MSKFENLTKYIPLLGEDAFGRWVIDRGNDGTMVHPVQITFVNYSDLVQYFINDVYNFMG